jgi:Ca2+-transporting ATPase
MSRHPPATATAWSKELFVVLGQLAVDPARGLPEQDVLARRQEHGPNRLRAIERRAALEILWAQFRSVIIVLLLAAAALSFSFGDLLEGLAIVAVILINTSIGFATELRAVRSIEALRKLGLVETTVRRDGRIRRVPAEHLVPGDIVLLEGGDIVTADLRIVDGVKLEADESTLTGESMPVAKAPATLPAATHPAERSNMLFKGTSVTRGSGTGVVTGIGLDTELGRITELVLEADAADTPLERRLDSLGRRLVGVTLVITALVAVSGIVAGREMILAIQVAIALAVATIPEGLPIVATIALARGMWRMARRSALVSKLSAVETLGATSVILTDKTGTLTENRMTVTRIVIDGADLSLGGTGHELAGDLADRGTPPGEESTVRARELLATAALCSNASVHLHEAGKIETVGDPTEVALLIAALKLGISRHGLVASRPEVREEPFDPATKAMATVHADGDGYLYAVKGAPESVLDHCVAVRTRAGDLPLTDATRREWLDRSHAQGSEGLRTLAVATKRAPRKDEAPYAGLVLLGVVAIQDPARPGVGEALIRCREAGIEVVMVTGDHPATALRIARDLGLVDAGVPAATVIDGRRLGDIDGLPADERRRLADARVVARASPEQKLDLIALHQQAGHVVAMTGDGVNDAPALRKADIGVAMGLRGTQVAKESAAMILQDDRFETIVEAVAQGRAIYLNIRKFVVYLMSCNISEILIVALATLAGAPLPLLPLQILFLNLVTDVFPALALGVGEGPAGLMRQRPRRANEPILTRFHWWLIASYGVVMCASVLGAMAVAVYGLGLEGEAAVTVSFLTLAFAQLWHVFNMRDDPRQWLRNEVVGNPWVWGAVALCVGLILGATHLPFVSRLLSITNPGPEGWAVVLVMSSLTMLIGPAIARLVSRRFPAPGLGLP